MITFNELGSHGRFGNQLFQYAALKSLAIKNRYKIILPILIEREWHGQKCLLWKLNIDEEQSSQIKGQIDYHEIDGYSFDHNFFSTPDNSNLFGQFQNKEYFNENLEDLKIIFSSKKQAMGGIDRKFSEFNKFRRHSKITSIHIRLGDLRHGEYNSVILKGEHSSFLQKSIETAKSSDFLIFTGGSRDNLGQQAQDVEVLKTFFKKLQGNFIFSESNDTLTDFELMKMCDSHILSPLSTFSLWVGYLAEKGKEVIAIQDYFLGVYKKSGSDSLYLDHWTKI
jgi:hypothetical protein